MAQVWRKTWPVTRLSAMVGCFPAAVVKCLALNMFHDVSPNGLPRRRAATRSCLREPRRYVAYPQFTGRCSRRKAVRCGAKRSCDVSFVQCFASRRNLPPQLASGASGSFWGKPHFAASFAANTQGACSSRQFQVACLRRHRRAARDVQIAEALSGRGANCHRDVARRQ